MSSIFNLIDSQYISYNTKSLNNKTVVNGTINDGVSKNAKKINISCLYTKASSNPSDTQKLLKNKFTVSQNNLPFVTEWEVPTTGPITLQVLKEIEEQETVPSADVVNKVTFNSANANLVTIEGDSQNPPLVTIDDNGLRMKDCYIDTPIDLQMFGGPNNNSSPVQGQPMEWDSQMIITSCAFDLNGVNLSEFEGLSVTGSVGPNNFIGLVLRYDQYQGSQFGVGISYDFDENKWVGSMTDYYNLASFPEQKRKSYMGGTYEALYPFDTDFITTMNNNYDHNDPYGGAEGSITGTYVLRSIPIDKVKNIPAAKWRELFDPNTPVDLSSKTNDWPTKYNGTSWERFYNFDPSELTISFVFAAADNNQPCRVTSLGMKKSSQSTNTVTKKVPALNPEDFTYDIKTENGKSAVRFEWSGWSANMTGLIFPTSYYTPIS